MVKKDCRGWLVVAVAEVEVEVEVGDGEGVEVGVGLNNTKKSSTLSRDNSRRASHSSSLCFPMVSHSLSLQSSLIHRPSTHILYCHISKFHHHDPTRHQRPPERPFHPKPEPRSVIAGCE